jgi:hypothetical protein
MSALDRLQQQSEQPPTPPSGSPESSLWASLASNLPVIVHQLGELTTAVRSMNQEVSTLSTRVGALESTTKQRAQPSAAQGVETLAARLNGIEQTLNEAVGLLSERQKLRLSDGSEVKKSDVDALALVRRLEDAIKTEASGVDALTKAVNERGHVVIDTRAVSEQAVALFQAQVATAVAPTATKVLDGAREVAEAVAKAEASVDRLIGKVTWAVVGRVAIALVPAAVILLMLGGVGFGAYNVIGGGALYTLAWDSFQTQVVWWQKALTAVVTIGGTVLFLWIIYRAFRSLVGLYGRWR